MPYHNTYSTPSTTKKSAISAQGQIAPDGYHYMPDGTLMSDLEHAGLYTTPRIITGIDIDFNDIKEAGETRRFTISGDEDAIFSLEVKNKDDEYYNFQTSLFQTTKTRLSNISISGGVYSRNIIFPKVTVADQYDFYLFSESIYNTEHANFIEVRFSDGSFDANSSSGSNANLVQKVIYQTLDIDITILGASGSGSISGSGLSTPVQTITTSRGKNVGSIPFSITVSVTSGALSIDRQPVSSDIFAIVERTIGAAPIDIEGEDTYPAVTETDVVDGDFSVQGYKIVMDTNVESKMIVGDRVTIATTALTDTVDGVIGGTARAVMDNNVITKMASGDRITIGDGSEVSKFLDANIVTVEELNPDGDNAKEFSYLISGSRSGTSLDEYGNYRINDGTTLTFTSKLNREVITVAALNPDTDNVKEFSMQDADGNNASVGILDNTTLSFSNQRNYRWPIDNAHNLEEDMVVYDSGVFGSATTIKEYLVETTIFEGEIGEYKLDHVRIPALDTLDVEAVISRNPTTKVATTTQSANITFSNQALLSYAGDTAKILSYGIDRMNRLNGYNLEFSDLKAELNTVTTTTTAAVTASTTIPVTSKVGIVDKTTQTVDGAITESKYVVLDSIAGLGISQKLYAVSAGTLIGTPVIIAINETTKTITLSTKQTFADGITLTFPNSIISGPGISSTAVNPYVNTISSLNLTASVAQTLENAQTLTFTGAGDIVTITGNIKVNKAGNEDIAIKFDIDKFLTQH